MIRAQQKGVIMSRRILVASLSACVLVAGGTPQAQTEQSVVAVWERISAQNFRGESTQPPAPPAFLVFTTDGYWAQLAIPAGRAKVDKPLDQMTREELLGRFRDLEVRRGTYTVDGRKVRRRNLASGDPNEEDTEQIQMFRIEGDLLIFNSPDPTKPKAEARFRRLK
jgi:hypothetical protein